MLLFFIFRCPNLVLLPVFYAIYAIRFMYKLYKNKLILLAALLQVSSVLMSNLGCIALPLPYHYPTTTFFCTTLIPVWAICIKHRLFNRTPPTLAKQTTGDNQ